MSHFDTCSHGYPIGECLTANCEDETNYFVMTGLRPPIGRATRVVNMKDDGYDVYIGRAGHGEDGYWGNPVRLYEQCSWCDDIHITKGSTLKCFKLYFDKRLEEDPEFKRRTIKLKGKVLGCFCKPDKCHGDIIADYLEGRDNG